MTYPYPRRLIRGFDDETEYVDWLADVFERFGWDVLREVLSDSGDSRVDLFVEHDVWGVVGIECKYKSSARPRTWATAIRQLDRYSNEEFAGRTFDNWVLAVIDEAVFEDTEDLYEARRQEKHDFFREFVNCMGYGLLRNETRMELVFNNSNPMVKVPVADVDSPSGELISPSDRRLERATSVEVLSYLE